MGHAKRIMISIPQSLLDEVDDVVCTEKCNRSELIRRALMEFISERQRMRIREQMKVGYASMAVINRQLCEEGMIEDTEAFFQYERLLAESEKRGS